MYVRTIPLLYYLLALALALNEHLRTCAAPYYILEAEIDAIAWMLEPFMLVERSATLRN